MEDKIIEGLAYAIPAAVTGFVAYFMFNQFVQQNTNEQKFNALLEKKRQSLPLKLQAYERLLLFCERISSSKLALRVQPIGANAIVYAQLLIANIEQEFEHNLVQQIYISDGSWSAILTAKNIIKTSVQKAAENAKTAKELQENMLIDAFQTSNATDVAIQLIKKEVKKLL